MSGVRDDAGEPEIDAVGQVLDFVTYVVGLTLLFAVVSAVAALLLGEPIAPGVKYGLFVFGWLAFGYGAFRLLPTRAWKDDDGSDPFDAPANQDTRFQAFVQRLPPARFRPVEPSDRVSTGARLFVASVVTLATSIVLEQVFGVGP